MIGNYNKIASANIQSEEPQLAIDALSKAYQLSRSNPEKALRINQQIADVYVQQKDFSSAIETRQTALNEPFVSGSTLTKSNVITSLADLYLRNNDKNSAVQLLRESYQLAVNNGHTLAAQRSVERLDSIYKSMGETGKSLSLYTDFLRALPGVISKDSSLADSKVIAETEQKLKLMEREKALTEKLIKEKNTVNTWLTILLIALAVFVSVVLFMLRKLNIHSKKIALQSLRREMNPHFIFNSLNSINQFIANNNELAANQYLTKFSTLMRSVMENSKDDMVLLSKEIDILRKYLELEKSRFSDKFDFRFDVDESLLSEDEFIPGMLLQPFLENAIWHGLRYKDEKGVLDIVFTRNNNRLEVVIDDNGIGIAESKKLKTANQLHHHGRGMSNTKERIRILNELYRHNISCQVEDKIYPMHGVKVVFNLPLLKHPL